MPPFPRSLAASLDHRRISDLLGIELETKTLPLTTRCPLCAKPTLELHWDSVYDAIWAWCPSCQFAGDLIELFASKRDLGPHAACCELVREGVLPETSSRSIERHVQTHVRVRRDVEALWKRASQRFADRDFRNLDGPLNRLGIQPRYLRGNCAAVAAWVGVSCRSELEGIWHPGSFSDGEATEPNGKPPHTRGSGPGASRLFRGRGWNEVLIVRSTDLPGRTCGFLIVGRRGDPEEDDEFYRAVPGRHRRAGLFDSGLMMREQLRVRLIGAKGRVKWPGAVFVSTNPVEAISLQTGTIQDGFSQPLPLVAIQEDGEAMARNCWSGIPGAKLVFWDSLDPVRAIRAALRVDGQVGRAMSLEEARGRAATLLDSVHTTKERAVPALARHLERLWPREAADLFRAMPLKPEQAAELSRILSPELAAAIQHVATERVFAVGKRVIRESRDGWEDVRSSRQLVNAVPRVEELVTAANGHRLAVGTVTFNGTPYSFRESVDEIETKGLFTVLQAVLRHQNGPELVFDRRWEADAWNTLLEISVPKRTSAVERVGWDPSKMRFVLPGGAIGPQGVECASAHGPAVQEMPLGNWITSEGHDAEARLYQSLSPAERTIFWAVGVLIAERVLGRLTDGTERGILVVGEVAQEYLLELGPKLGLLASRFPTRRSADDQMEWLRAEVSRDDVPPILDLRDGRGQAGVARWLEALGNHGALLMLPRMTNDSAQTQRRFHVLQLPAAWRAPRSWRSPARLPTGLLVEWFVDLAQRGFLPANRRPLAIESLIQDATDWVATSLSDAGGLGKLGWALTAADRVDPRDALKRVIASLPKWEGQQALLSNDPVPKERQSWLDSELARFKCPRIDWIATAAKACGIPNPAKFQDAH